MFVTVFVFTNAGIANNQCALYRFNNIYNIEDSYGFMDT